ncbi:hypothetical protein NDU88_006828 [Pleurodeles waltl]|uniref:Uncharacterized protein n=1 Tax=Pleurodeles waltl TaxID=8319 RepID=A0AAV7PSE2_PLEWA|nr:hypothetical protein NDU88_006828 [Pleurodeles waltl]
MTGAPTPRLTGETSPDQVDAPVWAPQRTAGWRKGVSVPGPGKGQGPGRSSLNTVMHGSPLPSLSGGPCHLEGLRTKPRQGDPTLGLNTTLAGDPEPKPAGEASLGPV